MSSACIVRPLDDERAEVEAFIAQVYALEFDARLDHFAEQLIFRRDARGNLSCAAGLRVAADGFFSEAYLREPVEGALARATGRRVAREDVFEVTTLASRSPRELSAFIDDIIAFGAHNGHSWAFFTLTRRLSLLVQRRNLAPIPLADADPRRVADPAAWGRYYETEPKVYGVCGARLTGRSAHVVEASPHAQLL
ncbi:thermostable hemolysin [Xanthobacter oligotrophicus]|uniref:Thermostable hemolysin n=1 Tax=Xanthobacter oligotrophicus TaxID=2607286 RepID=A0ABW6ZWN1_9HYPH